MKPSRHAICLVLVVAAGCNSPPKHLTEEIVLAAAEPVMKADGGELFENHKPYHATFTDGVWRVYGTTHPNIDG